MTNIPADWYDDGSGRLRYWDGAAWTDHFADTYAARVAAQNPAQRQSYFPQPDPQASDAGPAQPFASAPANIDTDGLGYATPGRATHDALADPFATAPRHTAYPAAHSPAASAPRKRLPGWGIALIVLGGAAVVIFLLGIVAAVAIPVYLNDQADSEGAGGTAIEHGDSSAVPNEIESVYWQLDQAYRDDSCEGLKAVTTTNYFVELGIDEDDCAGAFQLDEYLADFTVELDYGYFEGDEGFLRAYETYTDGDEFYGDNAEYTLVKLNGEWLFDSLTYPDY